MSNAPVFAFVDKLALLAAGLYAGTHLASCLVVHPTGAGLPSAAKVQYFRAFAPHHARSNGVLATLVLVLHLSLFVWTCFGGSGTARPARRAYGDHTAEPGVQWHYLASVVVCVGVFVYTSRVMFPINDRITSFEKEDLPAAGTSTAARLQIAWEQWGNGQMGRAALAALPFVLHVFRPF